ncbi:hypothetical protein OIU77_022377 [Salix suchowensis]|uniref:Uncharacterized protein n=1 Tax=Salix suchowensis TaxID=1278906 RepID=A0ABQ9C016_9ROSI|nr:hypothetical protein OIU77_022377 [Salix suchowensis]
MNKMKKAKESKEYIESNLTLITYSNKTAKNSQSGVSIQFRSGAAIWASNQSILITFQASLEHPFIFIKQLSTPTAIPTRHKPRIPTPFTNKARLLSWKPIKNPHQFACLEHLLNHLSATHMIPLYKTPAASSHFSLPTRFAAPSYKPNPLKHLSHRSTL